MSQPQAELADSPAAGPRVAYLGPIGTFSHEAVMRSPGSAALEPIPLVTIVDAVMAVHDGGVEYALVPIENSLEGSINATLDVLAMDAQDVRIIGEAVLAIRQCLIARTQLELEEIDTVVSHPQPSGQCARFIRTRLSRAHVLPATSTAEAVRIVADHDGPWAALGSRFAAEYYGCEVLRSGVEDVPDNETRFVWLGGPDSPPGIPGAERPRGPWKTAIVFWGVGSEAPGWLVSCLGEFADRNVNLTRIESRPRKQGLGRYMFFADLEGRAGDPRVDDALAGLRGHVEALRVLGSFPSA